ncbi:uncharacterized protein LOC142505585 isoform X1 [Primulina tabacum]|uniref:uncharacterized protein LOC142505585 isoform X1 n=1 Tax=Primulina tabacum TaxID=48773 RepID=UPI003F5A106F
MVIKKGSRPLGEYLKEFKSICDNLAAIRKPVPDLEKVFQFARGLGSQYTNFQNAWLTKPPYPSFNQFVLALQGHEQTLSSQQEEEKTYIQHAQAFFSQRGRGKNGRRGRFNSRGIGFTPAGRYSNIQNTAVQQHQNTNQLPRNFDRPPKMDIKHSNNSNDPDKVTCQICGKPNHLAIECWYRFDYSYQSDDLPQALAAINLNSENDPSFYVDSRATAHMTNDAVLQNESPYHKLYNRHPDYNGLQVLGCLCFPSLRHQGGSKFVKKTYPCVFIGYSPIHKRYRCLEPKSKRVYISRHVFLMNKPSPSNQHCWSKNLKSFPCQNFRTWMS